MTTTPNEKPSNWLEHITKHVDSKSLNKVHNSVVDIFKVTTNDELPPDLNAKMLESIIALNVNAVLCKSPTNDEMMIIHQLSKIGGDLLNPKVEYFGLTGFGSNAVPIRFCPKSILTITEVETPSWTTINSITDTASFDAARDANPTIMHFTNATPSPISHRGNRPLQLYLSFRNFLSLQGSMRKIRRYQGYYRSTSIIVPQDIATFSMGGKQISYRPSPDIHRNLRENLLQRT